MSLSEDQQKKYLLSKISEPIHFKYPEPPDKKGILLDRFIVKDRETNDKDVIYWNLIDLIKFEDEKENLIIVTYYRYRKRQKRKWVFAGQTAFSDPISSFEELFVKAIKEKEWIKPLFREVYERCSNELSL